MGEARRVYAAQNGVARTSITDSDRPHQLVVHTQSDIEPVLDSIARDREIDQRGRTNKLTHRLPLFVVEDLTHREIYDDPVLFKRWLNSPEADPWRIWGGVL